MCGICGKLNFTKEPIERELLQKMNKTITHRGPDDEGYYFGEQVGLAHRRLSIVDLSSGVQPMSNEDESIWIVFNGEIYNHEELRPDLEKRGHFFRSKSDTEVIVHLYEEWGVDCLEKLRGMFAFAIWDSKRERLFLARDRMGQKPLVYTQTKNSLLFASEAKALLEDPGVVRKVDDEAIHSYLTYLYIPAPKTAFASVSKLPPAHYLLWEKGKTSLHRYWKIPFLPKNQGSEEEIQEQLWELLRESTRLRLMSDVPLGAFLSGGIDSSAVVGIMSELVDQPVKTFSIGYKNDTFNELPYAREVAKMFATDHTEFIVEPKAMEILPKLIWHYSEPFADASSIPTYYVSKMAREFVTVALSGDAGDENFAGYDRYVTSKLVELYQFLPATIRNQVITRLVQLIPNWSFRQNIISQLKVFIKGASLPQEQRFAHRNSVFTSEFKEQLYTQKMKSQSEKWDPAEVMASTFRNSKADNLLDKLLDVDLQYYLTDDILVKVDIASMANSLEVRSPFLDHRLVEFAAQLPPQLKLKGLCKKYILKKTLARILPKEILHRKKMGFQVPTSHWFRNELKDYIYQVLLDPKTTSRGYFKKAALEKLLQEHSAQTQNHDLRIWALLNFELWHRMFIDQEDIA